VSSIPAQVRGLLHVPALASIEFMQQTSGAPHEHVAVPGQVTACAAVDGVLHARFDAALGSYDAQPAAIAKPARIAVRTRFIWCRNP
jgi:hypothetical protein